MHPGAVIGADGFGNARDGEAWVKVPQLGGVLIGDDVEIGANTTIDRGALGDTRHRRGREARQPDPGRRTTSHIGAHTAIAACTGIAGSTRIGKRCMIGGGTGIGGQLRIGDDIVIAGFGMVTRSITRRACTRACCRWRRRACGAASSGASSGSTCWPRA